MFAACAKAAKYKKPYQDREPILQGVLLPHEIFSSLYNYSDRTLFYRLFCGAPGAPWQTQTLTIQCQLLALLENHQNDATAKDLERFWSRNTKLIDLHPVLREDLSLAKFLFP